MSRLHSHFEEAVYFLPLSLHEFLVLIWSTSEWWKAEIDWECSNLTTRPLQSLPVFMTSLILQQVKPQLIDSRILTCFWLRDIITKVQHLLLCVFSGPSTGLLINITCTGDTSPEQRGFFKNSAGNLLPALRFLGRLYNFCYFLINFSLM